MAGIYVHIPFCRQACHYCNFHFSTSLQLQNDFVDALLKEIAIRRDYLNNEPVNTVYFGGGTPSLLSAGQLSTIIRALQTTFVILENAEVTLEANPDDINEEKLSSWKNAGINRLSIGVQSFFEEDLKWMNRAHNAEQAKQCLPLAISAGFNNISIDLIYGGPTLTDEHWMQNLEYAIELKIPHLSCYALTVEPETALFHMIKNRKVAEPASEQQAAQFAMMLDMLTMKGYEHYEISNFALPGFRSKHNSSYWSGDHYLGLGPSAHSFNGSERQWNFANNVKYIKLINEGSLPAEKETLTPVQQLNEYIMTSLRTIDGLSLDVVEKRFGKNQAVRLTREAKKYREKKWIQQDADKLVLTSQGKLFADGIAADLFAEEVTPVPPQYS